MPRVKRDMQRINIYVNLKILRVIKAIAKKNKMPYSELIRQVLNSYVKSYAEHNKKLRTPTEETSRLVDTKGRRFH